MKKVICISGRLMMPLKEGNRAVIACGGDLLYTSRVVNIFEETPETAHFETMNSVYRVALKPVTVRAPLPPFLKMCA